ncbi:MAG: GIY-YIG nuclease family protein [Bacteroidales bacterium]|nr:GIY-YIG nuclease family protein [Bacteroidales bacterium]
MYAIVDIETTGGSPGHEKITEIAVIIHDGSKITEQFSTLLNPEKYIPPHITALTGITNEMVAEAPKFYEIAARIIELTENKTFVAHNAGFDYGFIKNEFKSLGYHFQRDRLCTVRLSRKLIPGLNSYSLGYLCDELGIDNKDRHRAAGDAMATARLMEILMDLNSHSGLDLFDDVSFRLRRLNPFLNADKIRNLPEEAGVYYFLDDRKNVIYIGKSKNIKSRVLNHLGNHSSKRFIELAQRTAEINFELTGSELIALLKESAEIKQYKPIYNRAQRRTFYQYGLYYFHDYSGYLNFSIDKNNRETKTPLLSFSSKKEALNYLNKRIEEYELCQKLCGLYKSKGTCFHYELMSCRGACAGLESPENYNRRACQLLEKLTFKNNNMLIIDSGRRADEFAVVKIENGKYMGFGYVDASESITDPEQVNDYINSYPDNHDVQSIIRSYLRNKHVHQIIYF